MIKYHIAVNFIKRSSDKTHLRKHKLNPDGMNYLTTKHYRELPILELSEVSFSTPYEARDWLEKYEHTLNEYDTYNQPVIISVKEAL